MTHVYARTADCDPKADGDYWSSVWLGSTHIVRSDFMIVPIEKVQSQPGSLGYWGRDEAYDTSDFYVVPGCPVIVPYPGRWQADADDLPCHNYGFITALRHDGRTYSVKVRGKAREQTFDVRADILRDDRGDL